MPGTTPASTSSSEKKHKRATARSTRQPRVEKRRLAVFGKGHVVDIAEIGGDEDTGADVLYEVKCKSALKQHFSCGHGSATNGGAPASMGCKIGFGSTEEEERVRILGCKERGLPRDGAIIRRAGPRCVQSYISIKETVIPGCRELQLWWCFLATFLGPTLHTYDIAHRALVWRLLPKLHFMRRCALCVR